MTNIAHRPIFDTKKVEKLYSEKDGVPVTYVATTSANLGTVAYDVFYRATPHPEFGNHYFGLYWNNNKQLMITNADTVEDLDFDMIEVENKWHYSQHRHDFYSVGDVSIDGGRAYLRLIGNFKDKKTARFKIKDGKFKKEE